VRRTAAVLLAIAVVVVGVDRLDTGGPSSRAPLAGSTPAVAPASLSPLVPNATQLPATTVPGARALAAVRVPGAEDDEVGVARRWVGAMWTRLPGDPPFAWLDRVADITAAGLTAQLRTALPTPIDGQVVSATVDVGGVYPDAVDPNTVTVTCVAHLIAVTGRIDEPCATTVVVTPVPGGGFVVSAVL
jgi:hypothetical protein